MKNLLIIFSLVSVFAFTVKEDSHFAYVEKISDIPVFLFSEPTAEFNVSGKAMSFSDMIKMSIDEKSSIQEKVKKVVETAHKRVEKKKIEEFDALLIKLEDDKILAIKFKSDESTKAKINNVFDIPVFLFCEPEDKYSIVKEIKADYSLNAERSGLLFDKIKSMVNRTLKKRENKELDYFDAIIINPDDLSEKLILFKK
jgi:hypothetical protein